MTQKNETIHSQFYGSAVFGPGSAGISSVTLPGVVHVQPSDGGPARLDNPRWSRSQAWWCTLAVSQVSLHAGFPVGTGSQGGYEAAGGLGRSCEASGGLCWKLLQCHFSVLPQCLDQSKPQIQPSFREVEKETIPVDEKSNKSRCKGDGRMYGYFHNLQSLPNLKAFFIFMLLAHQSLLGAGPTLFLRQKFRTMDFFLGAEHAVLVTTAEGKISMNVMPAIKCFCQE